MKLFLFCVTTFSSLAVFAAEPPSCRDKIFAVNIYQEQVGEKIVFKNSQFSVPPWDANSQFDAVLLSKKLSAELKNPSLEVEFFGKTPKTSKTIATKELKPFDQDPGLKKFNFEPKKFFKFKESGAFHVRLKNDKELICQEARTYHTGD